MPALHRAKVYSVELSCSVQILVGLVLRLWDDESKQSLYWFDHDGGQTVPLSAFQHHSKASKASYTTTNDHTGKRRFSRVLQEQMNAPQRHQKASFDGEAVNTILGLFQAQFQPAKL